MTVVRRHNRKPIEKQDCQGDFVSSGRSCRHLAETRFGERENDIWLEIDDGRLEGAIDGKRPDPVLVVLDPFRKKRPKARFTEPFEKVGKFEAGVDQQVVGKVRVAGHMQFKGIPFDEVPVHDDPDTAVISRRNDADEENPQFLLRQSHILVAGLDQRPRIKPELRPRGPGVMAGDPFVAAIGGTPDRFSSRARGQF